MYGYRGIVLRVDLTREAITRHPLEPDLARDFLGGRGLNANTLFEEIGAGTDPLSPANVICFAPGPLSGTRLGMTSRVHVSTLSPYSGILGDGNAGEKFAAALKRAGYDQIVVAGCAERPVYLLIEDEAVALKEAEDLWGLSAWQTTDALVSRHGKNLSVACIGQAGENLVRFASTMVDKFASAARGSGAVLGSKRLKAIVVKGTGRVPLFDPDAFDAMAAEDRRFLQNDPVQKNVSAVYGSLIGMRDWYPAYRNHSRILKAHEVPEGLRPESWKAFEIGRTGCYGCPVRCKNRFQVPAGRREGEVGEALEYECIQCLGTNCGIEDPTAVMEMENICDAYGMDVIAAGNTIGLAKDLFQRGLLPPEKADGLSLAWEDDAAQVELLHRTALRQGLGNLVAEGYYSLAKILGGRAMDYCYHVKGLGRGAYPAGLFALSHATSTRGADHLRGRSWAFGENDPQVFPELLRSGALPPDMQTNPVAALIAAENVCTVADAVGRCKGAVNAWGCALPLVWKHPLWEGLARLLEAATGLAFTPSAIEDAANRIYLVERAFNNRQGITRSDDRLALTPEMKAAGGAEREERKHQEMLSAYYEARGYDQATGFPMDGVLRRYGLAAVAETLAGMGKVAPWEGPPLRPLDRYPHGGCRV